MGSPSEGAEEKRLKDTITCLRYLSDKTSSFRELTVNVSKSDSKNASNWKAGTASETFTRLGFGKEPGKKESETFMNLFKVPKKDQLAESGFKSARELLINKQYSEDDDDESI